MVMTRPQPAHLKYRCISLILASFVMGSSPYSSAQTNGSNQDNIVEANRYFETGYIQLQSGDDWGAKDSFLKGININVASPLALYYYGRILLFEGSPYGVTILNLAKAYDKENEISSKSSG